MTSNIDIIRDQLLQNFALKADALQREFERISAALANAGGGTTAQEILQTESTPPDRIFDLSALEAEDAEPIVSRSYNAKFIERNIEDAVQSLMASAAVRQEYFELSRMYIETKGRIDEFLRTDQVHRLEISNGVFDIPLVESRKDVESLSVLLSQANAKKRLIDGMFREPQANDPPTNSLLSDAERRQFVIDSARMVSPQTNTMLVGTAAALAERSFRLESAAWTASQIDADANVSSLEAKGASAGARAEFVAKDVVFRAFRSLIARESVFSQLAESIAEDSPVNFVKRITDSKRLFSDYFRTAIQFVEPIKAGFREIYDIDVGVPADLAGGSAFDRMSRWLHRVRVELGIRKRAERLTWVRKWVSYMGDAAEFEFEFSQFSQPPRLRGLTAMYVGTGGDSISLSVSVPASAVVDAALQGEALLLGRVPHVDAGADLSPEHSGQIWNGSPLGVWSLRLASKRLETQVDGVVLYALVAT